MDMGFDFVRNAKTLPVITTPKGVSHHLELKGRVPVWPSRRARIWACAGSEEAASPAPETEGPGPTEKTESLNRGEKSPPPPDHYLIREPKQTGCEVCQQVNRQVFKRSLLINPSRGGGGLIIFGEIQGNIVLSKLPNQ